MNLSILILGFLVGLKHALEADHLAAVASMAAGRPTPGGILRLGMAWGLGHAITLFALGSLVLLLDVSLSAGVAHALEFVVGVMLVLLGADVFRRLRRERIHIHVHTHDAARPHLHAHSHRHQGSAGKPGHGPHNHKHPRGFPLRALLVGCMHGTAGSAALLLLVVGTMDSAWTALLYMALFGVGSIVGMALLSVVIAMPLWFTRRLDDALLTRLHRLMGTAVGGITICLGLVVMAETSGLLG